MRPIAKRLRTTCITLFICVSMLIALPIKVYAWNPQLDEDNNIVFVTSDKKRSSDIYYKTVGVTVTRCAINSSGSASKEIHESKKWFSGKLDNLKSIYDEKTGKYHDTWIMKLDDIIERAAKEDPEWSTEIKKANDGTGPAVYIKIDCVMVTLYGDTDYFEGPYRNVPGYGGGDGKAAVGIDEYGNSMAKIFNINNGLKSHFNRYLLIGKNKEEAPKPLPDEFVVHDYTMDNYAHIDANLPSFAMGNYSKIFDLSEGIPSSEYIDNDFFADSWFANTNVYARTVGKKYDFIMTYHYDVITSERVWDDLNEDGIEDEGEVSWQENKKSVSEDHILPIGSAYVAFQYLADTHVYDFTNADIGNDAYDGDHIFYDDDEEVTMECISTNEYTDIAKKDHLYVTEPEWCAETSDHVTMPDVSDIDYPHIRELGSFTPETLPNISELIIEDTEAVKKEIFGKCKSKNDKLVIDHKIFMRNDEITGCDFFGDAEGKPKEPSSYKDCPSSSAVKRNYLVDGKRPMHETDPRDVNANDHVQIPHTVDNGYYCTDITVYYQRLVTYSKTLRKFEAH